jgi:hypothetical protein
MPPPSGADTPAAPPAAAAEPSSGETLADPYGISQAKPIPQPVGGNPYRGPDAAPPPPQRELPILSQSCRPGAECFDADPRLNDRFRAVRGSPFVQLLTGGFHFRERVSTSVAFGAEVGVFLFDRLRLATRALVPAAEVNDEISADAANRDGAPWLWGVSLGAAADRQPGFVLSPSLQYLAILGDDYGHSLGILMPLEWLSRGGVRVGFDFSLLYGFGGTYVSPTHGVQDRPNSAAFLMNFVLGYTFGLEGN